MEKPRRKLVAPLPRPSRGRPLVAEVRRCALPTFAAIAALVAVGCESPGKEVTADDDHGRVEATKTTTTEATTAAAIDSTEPPVAASASTAIVPVHHIVKGESPAVSPTPTPGSAVAAAITGGPTPAVATATPPIAPSGVVVPAYKPPHTAGVPPPATMYLHGHPAPGEIP